MWFVLLEPQSGLLLGGNAKKPTQILGPCTTSRKIMFTGNKKVVEFLKSLRWKRCATALFTFMMLLFCILSKSFWVSLGELMSIRCGFWTSLNMFQLLFDTPPPCCVSKFLVRFVVPSRKCPNSRGLVEVLGICMGLSWWRYEASTSILLNFYWKLKEQLQILGTKANSYHQKMKETKIPPYKYIVLYIIHTIYSHIITYHSYTFRNKLPLKGIDLLGRVLTFPPVVRKASIWQRRHG